MDSEALRNSLLLGALALIAVAVGKFVSGADQSAAVVAGGLVAMAVVLLTFLRPILGVYILVFSMLLSPEWKLGGVPGHSLLIRLDDLILVVIFFTWLTRNAILKGSLPIKTTPIHAPMFLYIFVMLLSTGLGLLRGEGHAGTAFFYPAKYIEYMMVFLLVVNLVETKVEIQRLLKAFFLTALLVLVFAYFIILVRGERPYAPFDIEEGSRETATLAGYLLIVCGMGWGMVFRTERLRQFIFLFALWVLSVPVLFLSGSRASYLAFAVMMAFMVVMERRRRLTLIFLILASFVVLVRFFPAVTGVVKKRVLYTFSPTGREETIAGRTVRLEPSAAARLLFWRRALFEYLPRHPLLGTGLGHRPRIEGQIPLVICETGLIGLALFIWIIARMAQTAGRLYRTTRAPPMKGLALGYLAGLVGLCTQALVNNTFIIIRIMEPLWFLTGLAAVSLRIEQDETPREV